MAERIPTPQQRRAATTTRCSLIVSAAAGSGKTSVLSDRCSYLVCDAPTEQRCAANELLVLTFTEAAAAEMRSRVRSRIAERCRAEPRDARLQQQLLLLDEAQICTIDAFCLWVVRQEFARLDVDPSASVADPELAALLLRQAVDDAFERRHQANNRDTTALHALLHHYFRNREESLEDQVLRLYEFLRTIDDPKVWIATARDNLAIDIDAIAALEFDSLQALLKAHEASAMQVAQYVHRTYSAEALYSDALEAHVAQLRRWRDLIRAGEGHTAIEDMRAYRFATLRSKLRKNSDPEELLQAKDRCKDAWTDVRDYFKKRIQGRFGRFSAEEWRDGLQRIAPFVETLLKLVDEAHDVYAEAKRRRNLLDFPDLEHLARELLVPSDGSESAVGAGLRARYRYVLIDEFQDVNSLQESLIVALSREVDPSQDNNLFCVGDIKQSIYGFRHADPQLIARRASEAEAGATGHDFVHLSTNFRSAPHLLEAMNHVFERVLTPGVAGIEYDDDARLTPGVPASEAAQPAELHLIDTSGDADCDDIEQQAAFIGQRINTLVSEDGFDFGDIVILLRATSGRAEQFASTLQGMGIPTASSASAGFFEAQEIVDVIALLEIADNLYQDIPLAGVLRSGILGPRLDETQLQRIQDYGERRPFHRAVLSYRKNQDDELADQLGSILKQLAAVRRRLTREPLATSLWSILHDSGYLAYVAGRPGGTQRRANLRLLHRRIQEFAASEGPVGLNRFIHFLDRLRSGRQDPGTADPDAVSAVVRIMTVHSSKGLEFPVVFFANLDKPFNVTDRNATVVFNRELGVGLNVVDLERRIRYPSLMHRRLRDRLRHDELAEELRILYVALTRAERRLIGVACCRSKTWENTRHRWVGHEGPLPDLDLLDARSMLDWILPALAAGPDDLIQWPGEAAANVPLFRIEAHTTIAIPAPSAAPLALRTQVAALEPLDAAPAAPDDLAALFARIDFAYPHAAVSTLSAVVPVSQLAHAAQSGHEETPAGNHRWPRPAFARTDDRLDPAELGTATHRMLQHLDYRMDTDLEVQLARQVQDGWLSAAEAGHIDLEAIRWFLGTEIGRRAAMAPGLHREVPFLVRRPAAALLQGDCREPTDDFVVLRGMIDLIVEDDLGTTIVDFKTDRIAAEAIDARTAVYRPQLRQYAMAVADIWRRRLHQGAIVFLGPRRVEFIDVSADSQTDADEQLRLWPD
jgi:ATP-dependent helicase/nuclease subunit A